MSTQQHMAAILLPNAFLSLQAPQCLNARFPERASAHLRQTGSSGCTSCALHPLLMHPLIKL